MAGATHWGLLGALDAWRTPLPWPQRLLLIGPGGLGDTVLLWPTLQRLQQAGADTHITWMGHPAYRGVVAMMGVHDFQPVNDFTRFEPSRFDAIVSFADLDGAPFVGAAARGAAAPLLIGLQAASKRPRWHNHLVHASRWGWPRHEAQRNLRMLLPFGVKASASVDQLATQIGLRAPDTALPADLPTQGHVVMHPFSAGHAREWPVAHWKALARELASPQTPVVFTGSAAEGTRLAAAWPPAERGADVHDSCGRLDMGQLAALLQRAAAVVACSTGPLHLAAALGTTTLGLFAPRKGLGLDRWAALGAATTNVQARRRCPLGRRCTREACACIAELVPQRIALALSGRDRAADHGALAPFVVTTSPPRTASTIAAAR
jgi:heptosyltransferase III